MLKSDIIRKLYNFRKAFESSNWKPRFKHSIYNNEIDHFDFLFYYPLLEIEN